MYGQEYLEALERKRRDDALRAEALAALEGLRPEVRAEIGRLLDDEKRQAERHRDYERMLMANQQNQLSLCAQLNSPAAQFWGGQKFGI